MASEMVTSDIGLASALTAAGLDLNEVYFEDKRAFFGFLDREKYVVLENMYFQNRLYVNAQAYHDNFRRLMARAKSGY